MNPFIKKKPLTRIIVVATWLFISFVFSFLLLGKHYIKYKHVATIPCEHIIDNSWYCLDSGDVDLYLQKYFKIDSTLHLAHSKVFYLLSPKRMVRSINWSFLSKLLAPYNTIDYKMDDHIFYLDIIHIDTIADKQSEQVHIYEIKYENNNKLLLYDNSL